MEWRIGKKNRFLTCSRPPRRGLEPDDVYYTDRVICIFYLAPGDGAGKFDFFDPSSSVVCHRLNNSLCLPVFPWLEVDRYHILWKYSRSWGNEIVYGTVATRYSFRELLPVSKGIGFNQFNGTIRGWAVLIRSHRFLRGWHTFAGGATS